MPEAWQRALGDAASEAALLKAATPTVTIVKGDAQQVWVDDVAIVELTMPLDPGPHVVRASNAEGASFQRKIVLREGNNESISVSFPVAEPVAPAPLVPAVTPPADTSMDGLTTAGILLLGAGGASLAAGVISGVMALNLVADAKEVCGPGETCAADPDDQKGGSLTFSYVSTSTVVLGAALAATGAVLLMLPVTSPDETASGAAGENTLSVGSQQHQLATHILAPSRGGVRVCVGWAIRRTDHAAWVSRRMLWEWRASSWSPACWIVSVEEQERWLWVVARGVVVGACGTMLDL